MIRKTLTAVLLISLFTGESFAGDKILPNTIYKKELPNGLNVVTVPFDSPGIAAFYIVVRVGSRDELEKGKTGFAHFFEHMMFRGTELYPKEKYTEVLKSTGASANANTSLDRTVYHMTGSSKFLEKMFELESDRFMNLSYSVQDFKTEAGAVKGEYTKNFSSPYAKLYEATNNKAFDQHTYKHTTMGFFDDIVAMPDQYEYSRQFFKRFYRPEYTTIIVVGDVTRDIVNELAEKYFGTWKRGDFVTSVPAEPEQKETKYINVQVPNFPPYLDLNYKTPAFSTKNNDFQALSILSELIASERSRLYKQLVIKDQKVRDISGGIYPTRDPYLFSISASLVSNSDMPYVYRSIMESINYYKNNPVKPEVLNEAKERVRYSFALSMDSPDAVASALAQFTWLTGDPESLNETYKIVDAVTPEDIMRVANKYLVDKHLTVATISPDENATLK